MKCPQCQHENPNDAKFCMECGAKLENVCPECGTKLSPDAKFCMECGAKIGESISSKRVVPKLEDMHAQLQNFIPGTLAQKYLAAEQQIAGENRPITALFADISGSTELANTRSTEAMFGLVQDCFKQLVDIVSTYEGRISGFRGDGLLALFGAPILHENDAERSILAAIEMRDSMHTRQLKITIGINTAMMTVGEIQTQLHSEYTAYGADIVIAKRLQEAAQPGQIIIGSGTHRLTRRAFDFDTLTALKLKGFSQPVTAYAVKQARVHPEKLRGIEGLRARMIGREHEFSELKDATDEWLDGRGQIVSIIGEAGIGKSRLVRELREYLDARCLMLDTGYKKDNPASSIQNPASTLEGRCVSIGQPISYWPFLDILRTYFGLSEDDSAEAIATKVTEAVKRIFPQSADDILPFLGNLLSIRFGNELDDRLKFATPEQIRHQTLMQLRDLFRTLADKQPLLLILEDLHWADSLSLDLLSLLMDELTHTPLMLLCVYRPEKEHPVSHLSDQAQRKCLDRYTEINLKKLSTIESRQLVDELLTIDNLPESVKNMILAKSEGNPFFIEEVIRSLIDRDMVFRESERWKARDGVSEIDVPDTIQSVILARVDRLQAEAKYVLQCASVIGRLFKYRLLEHLARHERDINQYLMEFEDKDLVYPEHTFPELEYAFKHALTQEATYQSILEGKRKEFHLQVAQGIERLYRERLEEFYEELAEHYSKSDNEKALEYLIKAGDKSKLLYANQQAIDYYNGAINIVNQFPEKREQKLSILEGLGDIYYLIGKPDEALKSYESALNCSDEGKRKADIYRKMARVYSSKLQQDLALRYINKAIEELGQDTHSVEMARIYYEAMDLNFFPARPGHNLNIAIEYGFKSLSILDGTEYKRELIETCAGLGNIYAWKGNSVKATQYVQKALSISQEIGDFYLRGLSHRSAGFVYLFTDWRTSVEHYKESIELFDKVGNIEGMVSAYHWLGITYNWHAKDSESAIKCFKAGIELDKEREFPFEAGHSFSRLSEIYRDKGEWGEAIKYAQEALNIGMTKGYQDQFMATSVCEVLMEAYLARGELDKVFEYFKKGLYMSIDIQTSTKLASLLSFAEEIYHKTSNIDTFIPFCRKIMDMNAEKLKKMKLTRWYLEPKELSGYFTRSVFLDEFDVSILRSEWQWVNPKGDCGYEFNIDPSWLLIRATSGCNLHHDLNFNAPRLMQEISGDFAIETKMASVGDDMLTMGGFVIWKDESNYICFERGHLGINKSTSEKYGKDEIGLFGSVDGDFDHFGRGMLASDIIYMRIERMGDSISTYCSSDGENWLTCGEVSFPSENPIQVGVCAKGNYALWNMGDTAIRFDYFKVLKPETQDS